MNALIAELPTVVARYRVLIINTFAATTLLLYEILITSGQEIRYVWLTSWTKINVLHVLTRYYALGFLLINAYATANANLSVEVISFCTPFNRLGVWGTLVYVPFVDLLIILRIYALYYDSKKVAVFLVALWIAEVISTLTFIGLQFSPFKTIPNPLPGILPGCFLDSTLNMYTSKVIQSGALVGAFQAIYFALTMYKLVIRVKSLGISMTPLLKVFFRDGAGYCLIIFAMFLLSVLLAATAPLQLQGIGQLWIMSIVGISAGRLVLNLRDVAADEPDHRGDWMASGRRLPWRWPPTSAIIS
ncbi:hypothetical protein JB92DRAFT_2846293 [Gautieria morchelliformis]|nr:hypothetical protein JB92DRAFT_2846293 [Gautieria morchelliformis]